MDLLFYNRWTFLTNVQLGSAQGPSLRGSNLTNMRMIVDTRTDWTYVLDSNCSSCKNLNKFHKHPNATQVGDGLPVYQIRNVELLDGYAVNDTFCIKDNQGVSKGETFKCALNRTIAVVTE